MANKEQVALLEKGSAVWNQWRAEHPHVGIDLSTANLRNINLRNADLSNADLSHADLRDTDTRKTNFSHANLRDTNLSHANLSHADLRDASLISADLSDASLISADLSDASLISADLRHADLFSANLIFADLFSANLSHANLSHANLNHAQVLYTNFTQATLTGACIADWQIGSSTILKEVKCDWIFCLYDSEEQQFSGRLPVDPESSFAPGEFTQRFQMTSVPETIDITFTEGIDWQAFLQSFQQLRHNRPDRDISIQGIECQGNALVVRLQVETEADKAALETEVKQFYRQRLAALEAQYEKRLRLQGVQIEAARQTIANERREKSTLMEIMATMAENQVSKYEISGTQFGGGFAGTV